jgi:hypothetical protein
MNEVSVRNLARKPCAIDHQDAMAAAGKQEGG